MKALAASVVLMLALARVSVAQAPQHDVPKGLNCPGDQVVWVNTRSRVYHFRGQRYFGSTLDGKYVCEKDAMREGDRATRNGQR